MDRLSPAARGALARANEEARRLNHDHVGTDHLLIGLAGERGGVAARILDGLGLTIEKLRSSVAFVRGHGSGSPDAAGELPYTPRLEHAFERAAQEATRRNQHEVGTLHLLLGIVRERQGLAVLLVEVPGLGLERIGAEMSRALREGAVDQIALTEE